VIDYYDYEDLKRVHEGRVPAQYRLERLERMGLTKCRWPNGSQYPTWILSEEGKRMIVVLEVMFS
jgi:hypothetical protein